MRLVDADKIEYHKVWVETPIEGQHDACIMAYENSINELPTVEAIPITDFYRMISNVQLDCDDDSGFSAEYRDGYSDGTRNAIIEMVQALCGDYDGDCDEFWEKFLKWDERRRENGADRLR